MDDSSPADAGDVGVTPGLGRGAAEPKKHKDGAQVPQSHEGTERSVWLARSKNPVQPNRNKCNKKIKSKGKKKKKKIKSK